MRRQQDEAYVLGTRVLGESDLIVTLLAHHHGVVRGVARAARASRRRFGGYLEPMSRVRASWIERDGRELHRLETIEGLRSYAGMQAEPLRQAACAVIAEVAGAFVQEGHGEPDTFRLVGAVLDALELGIEPWVLLRYFEYWMLRLHGLAPDMDTCTSCHAPLGPDRPALVIRGAGPACDACEVPREGDGRWLAPEARRLLGRMRREPPSALAPSTAAERSSGALEALLRGMLEGYAERSFRSYRHFLHAEGGPTERER